MKDILAIGSIEMDLGGFSGESWKNLGLHCYQWSQLKSGGLFGGLHGGSLANYSLCVCYS